MLRRFSALSLVGIVFALSCTDDAIFPTASDPNASLTATVQDRWIVILEDSVSDGVTVAINKMRDLGLTPDFVYEYAVSGFAATMHDGQVATLRADPQVRFLERDQVVTITTTQSPVPSWGLDRIDQNNLPLDNSYTYNSTGAGVTFYGLDTGIRTTHNDFSGRTAPGFTAILDGNGTNDCNGHGTHTASTAAGAIYGVAKGMTVVPVRVLNCAGSGTFAQVIAGIDWVTNNATLPAVANMSLSGGGSTTLDAAVAASIAAGVVYSVSAGNDNSSACFISPAREPTALTVASTTQTDARSSFSNTGICVDLFGPGSFIVAAGNSSNTAVSTKSGTSMSAPHVAGVAGLYLETNPTATPADVATVILDNATAGVVSNPGSGSPNLLLYMGFIGGGGPPPPPNQPPVADYAASCNGLTCTFDATASTDDNGIVLYEWKGPSGRVHATGPIWVRTFGSPGDRIVTLTVTDAGGLSDDITKTVTVGGSANQPPVATYTWNCNQLDCTFDGTGSTDDNGITSYVWTDGNGQQLGTGAVLAFTFPAPTTVQVTLTVTDAGGLTDTDTQTVTVTGPTNQPPVATYTWNCNQLDCTFDGTGSTDDNGITSYVWTDGNGQQLGTGAVLAFTFPGPTTVQVTLTVTDAGGLTDTDTQTVTVTGPPNQPPTAEFTWSCVAATHTCTFDGSSSTDDQGIVLYEWKGPSGRVLATGVTWTKTFNGTVTRTLTLEVTDGGGLSDSISHTVNVP